MLMTICERCQRICAHVRRPKWLATPAQLAVGCGGRCRGRVWLSHGARDELTQLAQTWGRRNGHDDAMVARLEARVMFALEQLDRRASIAAEIRATHPEAPWFVRVTLTRQALEREEREARKRRRAAQAMAIAVTKATAALARDRDRLDGAAYTLGIRRPAHWAPDASFANRRLAGAMPRDTSEPLRSAVRRARSPRVKDPTCGGLYKDPDAPAPAHVRRAAQRAVDAIAAREQLEHDRRAGVRRRPAGVAGSAVPLPSSPLSPRLQ